MALAVYVSSAASVFRFKIFVLAALAIADKLNNIKYKFKGLPDMFYEAALRIVIQAIQIMAHMTYDILLILAFT